MKETNSSQAMSNTAFQRFLPYDGFASAPHPGPSSPPTPDSSQPSSPTNFKHSPLADSLPSSTLNLRNAIIIATPGAHLVAHNSTIIDASTLRPADLTALIQTFPTASHLTSCLCKSPRTYPFSFSHPSEAPEELPDYRCPGAILDQKTDFTPAAYRCAEDQVKAKGGVLCGYCGYFAQDVDARKKGFAVERLLFGGHLEAGRNKFKGRGKEKEGEEVGGSGWFVCPIRVRRGGVGRCLEGVFGKRELFEHLKRAHGVTVVP